MEAYVPRAFSETKRYTIHHRVIHVQVHVCLSRPNGKRHDELSSSLLVSREIRDYIRTTMKEVATAHFFKSVSRCHRVSFVVFCHLCYYIVIYILLPFFSRLFFVFVEKWPKISLFWTFSSSFFISCDFVRSLER